MSSAEHILPLQSSLAGTAVDSLWLDAKAARERHWGKKAYLCGLVDISTYCRKNCSHCSWSGGNTAVARRRMGTEEIFTVAEKFKQLGFGGLVLQGGEDRDFPARDIAGIVMRIKRELGLAVTLALGEWGEDVYALWRRSGADRYFLPLETGDEKTYQRLRPESSLAGRLHALETLADLGYEIGSGLMTGLPDSSGGGLAQGLALLAPLAPDMAAITPFPGARADMEDENLRGMALARTLMPAAHMPVPCLPPQEKNNCSFSCLSVGNVIMARLPEKSNLPKGLDDSAMEREAAKWAANLKRAVENAGFTVPAATESAVRLRSAVQ